MSTIDAKNIVSVLPNVLAAGGSALVLSGLLLTANARVPIGPPVAFSSVSAVTQYFGTGSTEEVAASLYFGGVENAKVRPAQLLFAQYPQIPVAGWARGGGGLTLDGVKAITTGTLTVNVDGTAKTSSALNLSGATSLSNAASLIQAAFTTPGFTVTYDSIAGAFVITSGTTGAASTIAVTPGAVATALKLAANLGLTLSPGAAAATPQSFMSAMAAFTQKWAAFTTLFQPNTADKIEFSNWAGAQSDRYLYAAWDTDPLNLTSNPTTTAAAIAGANSGTVWIYSPVNLYKTAILVLSWAASIDFTATEGRATLAFKTMGGLLADVDNDTDYIHLIDNKVNTFGIFSTAANSYPMFSNGRISGKYLWADSFINQIWLRDAFQVALMTLLTNAQNIPYNPQGYGQTRAALLDPINQGIEFGAIRKGVSLTAQQIAQINDAAGLDAAGSVIKDGYYLSVSDPGAEVRTERGSPKILFFYADGQSIQKISFNATEVQ